MKATIGAHIRLRAGWWLGLAWLTGMSAPATAQAVINPTVIEFTLSPDHLAGMTYTVGWFLTDANGVLAGQPVQVTTIPASATQALAPLAPYAHELIRPTQVPAGRWICRVRAELQSMVGEWSDPSNPFIYSPTVLRPPGQPTMKGVGSGGPGGAGLLAVAIDDEGPVYLDGARIGRVARWDAPLYVTMTGGRLLAAEAINSGGSVGGVAAQLGAWGSGAAACRITETAPAGGWWREDYDDTGWRVPTEYEAVGDAPHMPLPGWTVPSPARWIWLSDAMAPRAWVRCRIEV